MITIRMITARLWLMCLLLLTPAIMLADEKNIQVILTEDPGNEVQLEVRQAPLNQVLDKIADATGVAIHYSVLPQGLVTATCVGTTVSQIITCLLDRKADLIFKYPGASANGKLFKVHSQRQPEEVWVLGTNLALNEGNSAVRNTAEKQRQQDFDREATGVSIGPVQTGSDETEQLLIMSGSNDPAQRMDAVSLLAIKGRAGDPNIRKALENALSDKDAAVRAQAISSLARLEGDGVAVELEAALQDSDVSVRLMAVDSAGDNPVLFQQALTDSDETVRALAAMKLEALGKAGG